MSQENVEIVRRFVKPYNGEDVIGKVATVRLFQSEHAALEATGLSE